MAGRGRGRGKSVSFDVQALGFGRGEALPAASLQPPPLFPTQEFKPVPLAQTEDFEYMLALKQEFIATLHKSPYYLKLDDKKRDINRYSDKYNLNQQDSTDLLDIDWRRFPSELKIKERKKLKKVRTSVKPNIPQRKKPSAGTEDVSTKEIVKTLETLEKKEETGTEVEDAGAEKGEDEEEKDEEQEDLDGDDIYDEDDLEEETDYAFSYFDNGEAYGDDDGDDDEGPVY